MRIVVLTGAELRHAFVRKAIALAPGIKVLRTYCEGTEKSLFRMVQGQDQPKDLRLSHLVSREASEQDFFAAFVRLAPDCCTPVSLPKGEINDPRYADEAKALEPDLVVAYGCSLIREPLLSAFSGRFLNVHLGLSPYYRGSGTNFWPLVEGRPECVGATFMHIDAGIDTGEIIHQIRATMLPDDTPHQIGNRLIRDITLVYAEVIRQFHRLVPMTPLPVPADERVCRKKDFSEDSVEQLCRRFDAGLIRSYLAEHEAHCAAVPILENPAVRSLSSLLEEAP